MPPPPSSAATELPAAVVVAPTACAHCADPVPAGLVEADAAEQFCCAGCRTVYEVLHTHGLEGYYDVAQASAARPTRARPSRRGYAELDDPALLARHAKPRPGGLLSIELYLEGVHCAACVWVVEKVPLAVPGTAEARLELGRSVVSVTWDPQAVALSHIARFLDAIGYSPHVFRGASVAALRRKEDRALLVRIGIAGAIAGNVMLLAFALYSGEAGGMAHADWDWFRWLSLGLTLPTLLFAGDVFFRGALAALRARTLSLDVPIAVGLAVGFAAGALNTLRGAGEVYFDSLSTLTFLLLVGRFVQRRGLRRAADAAEGLLSMVPARARKVEADGVREVPIEALAAGDVVEVRAGDAVPADGDVTDGASELDVAWLTGEPRPVPVGAGEAVQAGSVNLVAPLAVRVTRTGEETRVGRLLALVHEGLRRRAPVVQLADRISVHFVAIVLALAAATVVAWWPVSPARGFTNAIALLIVTCPCALGLATPLAIAAGVGRAAQAGMLIKGGDALERLARPGRIWLDKTGTLTLGKLSLARFVGPAALGPLVRALEERSSHPIALALVRGLPPAPRPLAVQDFASTLGGGVEGVVDGRALAVGSPAFASARGAVLAPELEGALAEALAAGETPVLVVEAGAVVALVGLSDALRPDAARTVAELRRLGLEVGILSGDHPEAVRAVAARLGIAPEHALGGASPERKLFVVRRDAARGSVVMVGDGVNDAAALAAATVGIAVHGGAEAGTAAADIFLTRPGLAPVAALVRGARRTLGVVRRNLVFAVGYNLVGATLAVTGLLDPILAAALMPASSLTVVASSYRARTFRPEDEP
ncbi:MAG: heavy metal translocating P-type ATPase [Myxococcales bacterium]|nr:heavy metal translocating P-type ATPase [Myxococcales bacterium]